MRLRASDALPVPTEEGAGRDHDLERPPPAGAPGAGGQAVGGDQ